MENPTLISIISNVINKLFITILIFTSFDASSQKWSRFISTKNTDDIKVSFRQKRKRDGWLVEWKVVNGSSDKIETLLKFRKYQCEDGSTVKFEPSSLGIILPESIKNSAIKDDRICPGSSISLVEIETEIHQLTPVSDAVSLPATAKTPSM